MTTTLKPGDRVTWWWTADNCRCVNNGHQDPDTNTHPVADGRKDAELAECAHHRVLTGYPATVAEVYADDRRTVCVLDVEMPAGIGPGSRHNLTTRQGHSPIAEGPRPRSGECTIGDAFAP